MVLTKIRLKRLYRQTGKARFVVTSVLTATGIFLYSSVLPSAKAVACVAGLTTGFFCAAVGQITQNPPFDGTNAVGIQVFFLALNLVIAVRILWKGYQAWSAREAGEEFQSTVNGIIIGLVILFILEGVANRIVGVP